MAVVLFGSLHQTQPFMLLHRFWRTLCGLEAGLGITER